MAGKTEYDLNDTEISELSSKLRSESENNNDVLLGELEPLEKLRDEYVGNGQHFHAKLVWLEQNGWTRFRRAARDAFITALLEAFVDHPDRVNLCTQFLAHIELGWSMFAVMGYQDDILEDFWEPLKELVDGVQQGKISRDGLVAEMNKKDVSSYIIVFLRLLTAAYMEKHSDDFLPFLLADENDPKMIYEGDQPSVKKYYENYVQPAYKDADDIAITALTRALSANLLIACLDQTMELNADGSIDKVHIVPYNSDNDSNKFPTITLLFRPGHYDTIYKS